MSHPRRMLFGLATSTHDSQEIRRGALAASASYVLWGVVPLYWKQLDAMSPFVVMAHRMVWTLLVVMIHVRLSGEGTALRSAWRNPAARRAHAIGAALLSVNWCLFIWAVANDHILESSLGYFLVPLLNAALGRLLLGEHLRHAQKVALGFAAAGVLVIIAMVGSLPWIALGLAGTWAAYGLNRKRSPLSAPNGLAMETGFTFPFALLFLVWIEFTRGAAFGSVDTATLLWLVGTGLITTVPLTLFAYGARRLRLTTIGLLQYVTPTGHFLIGWLIYGEPFSATMGGAFALIWAGLAIYSFDAWLNGRRSRLPTASVARAERR